MTHNHALGTIHDECTVCGHDWNLAEIHLLFFDVGHRSRIGFRIDIPQPNGR